MIFNLAQASGQEAEAQVLSEEPQDWRNDFVASIVPFKRWLSVDDRGRIGERLDRVRWQPGQTSSRAGYGRRSLSCWIEESPDTGWLYQRLSQAFAMANRYFKYDIRVMNEELQVIYYREGGFLDWHLDLGPGGASTRKLAMVALLDRSADCQGGELEFGATTATNLLEIGDAMVFPAFLTHRVTPLRAGTRKTLVAWACGPSLR